MGDLPFLTKLSPDSMWVSSVMVRRAVGEDLGGLLALDIEGKLIGDGSEVSGTLVIRERALPALRDMLTEVIGNLDAQQN